VGYGVSQLSSGSVTANTLTVFRRQDHDRSLPRVFETILTTEDGTVEYQLRTHVCHSCSHCERVFFAHDSLPSAKLGDVKCDSVKLHTGHKRTNGQTPGIMNIGVHLALKSDI